MSFALPSKFESASSPAAKKGDISPSKIFNNLSAGPISFSQNKPTIDSITNLDPGWPISCRAVSTPIALDEAHCIHIATEIESGEGAQSLRIYSADDGIRFWRYGTCLVSLGAWRPGYTDVFKPILIAQNIRRVVEVCVRIGLGGATYVGPRRRFVLSVDSRRLANGTVAIG